MPTTNPVPSTDPSDLLFNAGKLDEVVNGSGGTYTDRLGVTRRTLGGIDAEAETRMDAIDSAAIAQRDNIQDAADLVLAAAGYAPPVAYAAGITLTLQTQTVSHNGDTYAPKQSELPFTTSGTFEVTKFRLIQGVASADLPALVGQDVQDYAALRAYTGLAKRIYITGLLVTKKPAGIAGVFQYDQTDTTSADNGGTIIAGADGRRWKRDFSGPAMSSFFGSDGIGVNDSSAAIIAALAAHNHVVVEGGVFRCDSMIELTTGKTLQLLGDTTLVRKAANSTSTDPVVWIKGSSASFFGAGMATSTVKSENRSPKGVVRIGHKDMTESHGNVNYCSLQNMTVVGAVANGQTTGEPDIAVYMPNPQFGGLTSYFHNLLGVRVMDANFGIYLHGNANANTISSIHGYRIGNTTLGANKNVFIYCHGAKDNTVSTCFFHASANSIGLLVDNCDNTINGGSISTVYANSWKGMVFEQGGASAYGLKSLVFGGRSYYEIISNVALGNSVPAGFTDNNILVNGIGSGISGSEISFGAVTSSGNVTATGKVSGATVESLGEVLSLGSIRSGDTGAYYIAKKTKRNATTNAASVSFTLSNTAQASIYRYGYIRITVAGGDNGAVGSAAAWFFYLTSALGTAYPSVISLKDSGGDTASITVTNAGNGVITVSSTQDAIVCELEYGFTTTNVNVT